MAEYNAMTESHSAQNRIVHILYVALYRAIQVDMAGQVVLACCEGIAGLVC
jgi:hypothetical protein